MKIASHFYDLCGNRRDTELRHFFLPNTPQFGKRTTFSWQKVVHGHQSAVPLPSKCGAFDGRKQHDLRHFFKCCHAAFVVFILTRTVHTNVTTQLKIGYFWWFKYLDLLLTEFEFAFLSGKVRLVVTLVLP